MRLPKTGRAAGKLLIVVPLLWAPLALGACGDDEEDIPPPLPTVTPDPEPSPELGDITDDYFSDASYVGRTVTVEGTVREVISRSSFVLAGEQYGDESLLVISAPTLDVEVGRHVEVTGVVRTFGHENYADGYDLADDTDYTEFDGEEMLVVGGSAGSPGPGGSASASPGR